MLATAALTLSPIPCSGVAATKMPPPGPFDARVHRLVAQIADNRLAGAFTVWIVNVLQPRLRAVIEPAVVEAVIVDQHRDLLEAIVRGDPVSAERAMREHLVYLRDLVSAVLMSDQVSGDEAG